MNEFVQAFGKMLEGFPAIILVFLAPMGGALAVAIVAALGGEIRTPAQFLGQFTVGTLVGWFCSALAAPFLKGPPISIGFITGASGFWGLSKYLKKKQDDLLNKPPGDGQNP